MHSEWGVISAQTAGALNAVCVKGGRIVAVGTTSLRLLESAAAEDGTIGPFSGEHSISITPGYRFRARQTPLTNFTCRVRRRSCWSRRSVDLRP